MRTNTTIRYKLMPLLLLLAGCNKLLDVPPPPNDIGIVAAFKDSVSAVSAISGIYNGMILNSSFEWSGISFNTARSADDVMLKRYSDADFFSLDSLLYTDGEVEAMWVSGFNSLLMINTCIRGLQPPVKISTSLHHQLLGEALFCRAFVYFYIVNLWGDAVPLITSPDVDVNRAAKSVPRQQIYDQIIADLTQAQKLLTNSYPSAGRVRPNLMAANALLARVYLYQGRYSDAVALAGTLIGSDLYSPMPAIASVFRSTSKEAIWQLMPPTSTDAEIAAVGDVAIYRGSFTSLTPQLSQAFEPRDRRRTNWVIDNNLPYSNYTTASKYMAPRGSGANLRADYYIVLRLAEQYLIRAEAYTRLGQIQPAITDLNILRTRAGLSALSASLTQKQCMSAVEQERRVELFTEWGHRWFDLKRWPGINNPDITRADEVLGTIKSDWQPTDIWYPVPRSELLVNTSLVQNPGYPKR